MAIYYTSDADADWQVAVTECVLAALPAGDEIVCTINPVAERRLAQRLARKHRKRVRVTDGYADWHAPTTAQRLADALHDMD